MRTLLISDMHLGARSSVDLLRREDIQAPLLKVLEDVDRLVILGDGLELRESPLRDAASAAGPLFGKIGQVLGPEKEIIYVAGNHDHGLVAGWIDVRLETEPPGFLELEQHIKANATNGLASRLAKFAEPAKLTYAYPGIWLRDDVYAIHGHYSDVHTTIPMFERIAAGVMARWAVNLPLEGATPDDYEAVLSPLYAWIHALAQRSQHTAMSTGANASARAWVALAGAGRRRRPVRAAALGLGFAGIVGIMNAAGFGPIETKLSGTALRQGGLRSLEEVLKRLGVNPPHVIFGHSHRSGPWPDDDREEWITKNGTLMTNTGSWVYQPHFLSGMINKSAYWPGTAVLLEDYGPPRLVHLLGDFTFEQLRADEHDYVITDEKTSPVHQV